MIAALKACCVPKLDRAPAFEINVSAGDSLLHGPSPKGLVGIQQSLRNDPLQHYYDIEDGEQVRKFLTHQYHVVVGNPPYITVKDQALNQAYRTRFSSCHGKYSLAVPFKERFFDLAIRPEGSDSSPAGFVGMITANSFMKREFGKKLIEEFIPRWDVTHVIDTSGAYIPGHGTPTVILFGRNRQPLSDILRAVMGIRGEASTPAKPSEGQVWTAIMQQLDIPGSQSEFVSVTNAPRASFHKHPWNIGGAGAAELKDEFDTKGPKRLDDLVTSIGFASFPGLDEVFVSDAPSLRRRGIPEALVRPLIVGENIRDWTVDATASALVPYDKLFELLAYNPEALWCRALWPCRTSALNVRDFGGRTRGEAGHSWYGWYRWISHKYRVPLSISFAEIASHNQFILDRGGSVFTQTAPVIKLPQSTGEDNHLCLLGLLNSSSACFWMKQVAHQKQMMGGDGVRVESRSKVPYQFSGTQLGRLPIPLAFETGPQKERLTVLAESMNRAASELTDLTVKNLLRQTKALSPSEVRAEWQNSLVRKRVLHSSMVWLQEEIDFTVYSMYGLIGRDLESPSTVPPPVDFEAGQRPFEILSGNSEDGFDVPDEIPTKWPEQTRSIWRSRIEAIQRLPKLKLIENPHYKRRWIGRQGVFNHARDSDEFESACKDWLRDALESSIIWNTPELKSCAKLAEFLQSDKQFRMVSELYRGRPDFELIGLIEELIEGESVPLLPTIVYKESGLNKRIVWKRTWDLQCREDAIDHDVAANAEIPDSGKVEIATKLKLDQIGHIPAPPKYESKDFQRQSYWSLRGKLDVPKERFISFPYCERDADQSAVVGWAGWNHLQRAQAIAAYYERVKTQEGWTPERRIPLLTGILELLPWLRQWHNDIHPEYHERMGDFFQQFAEDEARAMEMTLDEIRAWTPPAQSSAHRRKKRNT